MRHEYELVSNKSHISMQIISTSRQLHATGMCIQYQNLESQIINQSVFFVTIYFFFISLEAIEIFTSQLRCTYTLNLEEEKNPLFLSTSLILLFFI